MTKILVIDDIKDNLISISALVKSLIPECGSITAQSGKEGIKKALGQSPDTILLDIKMPGMDGFEVCKRLKSDKRTAHIPIIMLTAVKTDTQNRIEGLEIGADAFLSKPVDEAELVAQIKAMLRIKKAEDVLRKEKDSLDYLIKEINQELEETEGRYQLLFNAGNDAVFVFHIAGDGKPGQFIEVNEVAWQKLGYTKKELLKISPLDLDDPEARERIPDRMEKLLKEKHILFENKLITKKGEEIPMEINAQLFQLSSRPTVLSIARDITMRKQREEDLRRSNRALQMLVEVTQAVMHSADESRLLHDICRSIIKTGGYRLAWVGFASQDENRTVNPVAQAGFEQGFLKQAGISWENTEEDTGRVQNPTGAAIHTGRPCICRNILTNPRCSFQREEAAKRGYQSSIALPLIDRDCTIGALNIYAVEQDAFDTTEVELLLELSTDLAYGINALRTRVERERVEKLLRESERELRILSSKLLIAQEGERKRVAGELHDGIGQSLTAIKVSIENILDQTDKNTGKAIVESLESLIPMSRAAVEEVRRISMNLHPSILDDLGILATIAWACREFQAVYSGIEIEKEIDVQEDEVPVNLKTVIYRVLQEALNNVAKHSKADLVRLILKKSKGKIELAIRDNGRGFNLKEIFSEESSRRGFGLAGMRERTELPGGIFTLESIPEEGTLIKASWPLQE